MNIVNKEMPNWSHYGESGTGTITYMGKVQCLLFFILSEFWSNVAIQLQHSSFGLSRNTICYYFSLFNKDCRIFWYWKTYKDVCIFIIIRLAYGSNSNNIWTFYSLLLNTSWIWLFATWVSITPLFMEPLQQKWGKSHWDIVWCVRISHSIICINNDIYGKSKQWASIRNCIIAFYKDHIRLLGV